LTCFGRGKKKDKQQENFKNFAPKKPLMMKFKTRIFWANRTFFEFKSFFLLVFLLSEKVAERKKEQIKLMN